MRRIAALMAVIGLILSPAAAEAKGGPKWKGAPGWSNARKGGPGQSHWKHKKWKHRGKHAGKWHGRPGGRISYHERDIIRRFYGHRWRGCRRHLPPGIRMNLARGKPLPPGLRRRVGCRLPRKLVALLPPRPGYFYYWIGDDLVLISRATNLIVDVARRLF